MQEMKADLWDLHAQACWICIPTNGDVDKDGRAVMGAGLALEAAKRFPYLPSNLGWEIRTYGSNVYPTPWRMICVPTKHHWQDKADLELIERSCKQLVRLMDIWKESRPQGPDLIFTARLGCGLGQLTWEVVKPVMERALGYCQVIVVEKG